MSKEFCWILQDFYWIKLNSTKFPLNWDLFYKISAKLCWILQNFCWVVLNFTKFLLSCAELYNISKVTYHKTTKNINSHKLPTLHMLLSYFSNTCISCHKYAKATALFVDVIIMYFLFRFQIPKNSFWRFLRFERTKNIHKIEERISILIVFRQICWLHVSWNWKKEICILHK